MNEIKNIRDQLNGEYWQMKRDRHLERYFNNRSKVLRHAAPRHHPYQNNNNFQTRREKNRDSTFNLENSVRRIEQKQEQIAKDFSDLKTLLSTKEQRKEVQPVSSDTFARFLNHFEQTTSDLRQAVENISKPNAVSGEKSENIAKTSDVCDEKQIENKVTENAQQDAVDCASQLLMLKDKREESVKLEPCVTTTVGSSQPPAQLTIWSVLHNSEPKTSVAKWSFKTNSGAHTFLDESLSCLVENAYKQYFSNGQYNPAAHVVKYFETDTLYIDFESRRGSFKREPVCFVRTLC